MTHDAQWCYDRLSTVVRSCLWSDGCGSWDGDDEDVSNGTDGRVSGRLGTTCRRRCRSVSREHGKTNACVPRGFVGQSTIDLRAARRATRRRCKSPPGRPYPVIPPGGCPRPGHVETCTRGPALSRDQSDCQRHGVYWTAQFDKRSMKADTNPSPQLHFKHPRRPPPFVYHPLKRQSVCLNGLGRVN